MDYATFTSLFLTKDQIDPEILAKAQKLYRSYRQCSEFSLDYELSSDHNFPNGVAPDDNPHAVKLRNNVAETKKEWEEYCKKHGIDAHGQGAPDWRY